MSGRTKVNERILQIFEIMFSIPKRNPQVIQNNGSFLLNDMTHSIHFHFLYINKTLLPDLFIFLPNRSQF